MAITTKVNTKQKTIPKAYIDLQFFIHLGIGIILLLGPFMNGLFFEPEWLFMQIIIAGLVVLHWLDRAIKNEGKLEISYFDILNLVLVAMYFLSMTQAVNMHGAYGIAFRYLSYYLVFFLVSRNLTTLRTRGIILNILFIATVGVDLIGIMTAAQVINVPGAYAGKRITSVFQYGNTFGAFLAAGFFIGLALWNKQENILTKIFYASSLYLLIVGIIGSQSRGTWLLMILVGLIYFILLFLQKQHFWRSTYNLLIIMTASVVGTKGFLENVYSNKPLVSLKWLLLGLAIVAVGQLLYQLIEKMLVKIELEHKYRTLLVVGSLFYILVIGFVYLNYMGNALPSLGDHVAATEITKRVQSIEASDGSFTDRKNMFKWAWWIMLDHPLLGTGGTGWNARYHQYQEYLYWSTEVHSHFLQVGVETGFVGFIVNLAMYLLLGYLAFRLWSHEAKRESLDSYIAILMALSILVFHSAMDFDFTYGIMPITTMILAGLLFYNPAEIRLVPKTVNLNWQKSILLAILSLSFFVLPSNIEYRAGVMGAKAANAMEEQQFDQAILNFELAHKFSPFNHRFTSDLGQLYSAKYVQTSKPEYREKADYYIEKTLELSPNDLKISQALIKSYALLGEEVRITQEQERLVSLLPKDRKANISLATRYFNIALTSIKSGELATAKEYLIKTEATINKILDYKPTNIPMNQRWRYNPLPEHYLLRGQLHFLKGQGEEAFGPLQEAAKNKETKDLANAWQAAAYLAQENPEAGEKVKKQIKDTKAIYQINEITKLFGQVE